MSKLKVRAWSEEDGRWKYYTIGETISDKLIDYNAHCINGERFYQSTGLIAVGGVEIFEGDIVQQDCHVCYSNGGHSDDFEIDITHVGKVVIVPSKGVCMYQARCTDHLNNDKKTMCTGYTNVRSYRAKVIGNIHEHPELLKGIDHE